ncbi:MAG TPA: hypothetical protein VGH81_09490 [Rudaea sp.]|jgi:hypothetical protein
MKQSTRKAETTRRAKAPSQQAILRAVASSTAIETGQSIAQIERSLRSKQRKFAHVGLAR